MAENQDFSKQGQSPFRRYVPPASQDTEGSNGQVMPFSKPSQPVNRDRQPSPLLVSRRSRSARNQWRQWTHSASPATPTHGQLPTSHPPQSHQGLPKVTGTPARSRVGRAPAGVTPSVAPPPRTPRQMGQRYSVPHRPPTPRGGSTNPSTPASAGASGPRRPATASKVTPLRRQPIWSSPADQTAGPAQPPRDRQPPARRRLRQAPRPVLYGIRLLIVGTGLAAIAGTLLSTLNPDNEPGGSSPLADGTASELVTRASQRQASTSGQSMALPFTEELAYLETDLIALEAMTPGLTQSVFFYDLDGGSYVDLNGTTAVSAASTIKVPILIALLEAVDTGTISLDQALTLREDLLGGGSGDMQTYEIGSQHTTLDVATAMIINSDNTATNMIIDGLGGRAVLNQRFQAWGLQATVLRSPLPDLEGTNTTSPADLVRLMALVDRGELLSLRSRDRLLAIMQRTYNRALIPDGLRDDNALVFNKTGDIGTALGDIALVDVANGKRYALGILVTRPHNDGRANELIRRVAGRIHEEMAQPINPVGGAAPSAPPSELELPE